MMMLEIKKMEKMTLERWVAVSTIVGAIASILIGIWPILFEAKPSAKGILIMSAATYADQGQAIDTLGFFKTPCNGAYNCSHNCDHSLFGGFGPGSQKVCQVSYTCNGDEAEVQHVRTNEPLPVVLECGHPVPWRTIVLVSIGIIALAFAAAFAGRRFVYRAAGT